MIKIINSEQVKMITNQINSLEVQNYIYDNFEAYRNFLLYDYQREIGKITVGCSFFGVLSIIGGEN